MNPQIDWILERQHQDGRWHATFHLYRAHQKRLSLPSGLPELQSTHELSTLLSNVESEIDNIEPIAEDLLPYDISPYTAYHFDQEIFAIDELGSVALGNFRSRCNKLLTGPCGYFVEDEPRRKRLNIHPVIWEDYTGPLKQHRQAIEEALASPLTILHNNDDPEALRNGAIRISAHELIDLTDRIDGLRPISRKTVRILYAYSP